MTPGNDRQRVCVRRLLICVLIIMVAMLLEAGSTLAQGSTELVSINRTNTASGNAGSYSHAITPNGRFVAFGSDAANLTEILDVNGPSIVTAGDVFVRDRWTKTTKLVSVNYAGTASGNGSSSIPAISPDGRYVAFQSSASDLVHNDTNGPNGADVFVRDLQTNKTTLVSVNYAGTASGNRSSHHPLISDDGRYVVFYSQASDIIANDTNGHSDVFVRDLQTGTTTLVSINRNGTGGGNANSFHLAITPDGRYIVFASSATDLTPINDTNNASDLFVRDLRTGTTQLVSINRAGTASGNGESQPNPVITPDGHYVAFVSNASDLTEAGDANRLNDVFVRDLQTGMTTLVSVNLAGTASGNGTSTHPAISVDGRYVAFASQASNLAANDTNGFFNGDVFVRDLRAGTTQLVSINRTETGSGNGDSFFAPTISADGRYVAFPSRARDLAALDNPGQNIFVRDLKTQTTQLASTNLENTSGGNNGSYDPLITPGGQYVAYSSLATNLAPDDTNNAQDVFVFTTFPHINPIDDAWLFVRQHYLDFLDREPDQGGWDYWTNEITKCGNDTECINRRRLGVSAAFFVENEFQRTGGYVYRLYRSTLGRQPTYAEFTQDRKIVVEGDTLEATKAAYAEAFVRRAEFLRVYPAEMTAEAFVTALLQGVQQTSGVNLSALSSSLMSLYNGGAGRAAIVRTVADDAAFAQAVKNNSFVRMEYFGYLRRDPDPGGEAFWNDVLNNREPNNYRGMVCAFLTSREYQERFGSVVPHSDVECASAIK